MFASIRCHGAALGMAAEVSPVGTAVGPTWPRRSFGASPLRGETVGPVPAAIARMG